MWQSEQDVNVTLPTLESLNSEKYDRQSSEKRKRMKSQKSSRDILTDRIIEHQPSMSNKDEDEDHLIINGADHLETLPNVVKSVEAPQPKETKELIQRKNFFKPLISVKEEPKPKKR